MKSRFFKIVTPLLMLSFFLFGITPALSSTHPTYNSAELTNRLKTGAYLQKTDNLMIIIDGQRHSGWLKSRSTAKLSQTFIEHLGTTIPKIPHRRMLRVFGPDAESFEKDFSTTFGLYYIDAKGFTPIIATKTHPVSDFDPLGMTFISGTRDLRKLSGTHAVVLISDGVNIPKSAIYESAYMKKKFRGSVCYYPILIGNDPQGAKNMSTIAKIGGCGFLAQYESVDSPAELTDYVEKIFFAKRRVPVKPVEIAATEPEVKPEQLTGEETAEPVMTDTEEVTEIVDEPVIPDIIEDQYAEAIPAIDDDIIILERQLPHDKVVTIELNVEFDLNKATLRTGYEDEIKKVADFMVLYPETEALLEGHTCDLGSEAYNQQLSSRRATTVKNYLVKNFNINPDRLKTRGAGESEPIASNATEEGRMKNRRVMAVISTIVTDYIMVEQEILKTDFLSDDFVLPPVDQIVDEMMQQEVVEEPQEAEMPESGADDSDAPEADSLAPEAPPLESTLTPEQPETTEAVEITPEEDSQTAQEAVDTKAESEVEPSSEASLVEDQQETAEQGIAQPEVASSPAPEPAAEESIVTPAPEKEFPAGGEPIKAESTKKAPSSDEDVVVVSPGESAFDDKGASVAVGQIEEEDTESVSPVEPEEKENTKKIIVDDEDSYL